MEIKYTINDNFDSCFVRDKNDIYSYYNLLKLLNDKSKAFIKKNKTKDISDSDKIQNVLGDFEISNLSVKEEKAFEYWRKQSKAKSWFSSQRTKRRKGKLKQYQIEMLNKIGMMWNPKDDEWEKNFIRYKGNLVGEAIIIIQNYGPGISNKLLNNLKLQDLWIREQRDDFKTGKIVEENLTRLNSINFTFTPKPEETFTPSIYSLINYICTIYSLNEELKRSRKKFINFYKLPKELKTSNTSIEIKDVIVQKIRNERKNLELLWDKKRFEKYDNEQQESHKIATENITKLLGSKSKEYFFNQIDRYGKQKPLTWNEEQNFKDADKNLDNLDSYQFGLYHSSYIRLSNFLHNSYNYQGKINGIYYSTSIKYEFCDEIKCYASEKMLKILNEKLLATGRLNKTKSFEPIPFLINYYKKNNLLTDLVKLDEIIQKHQILTLIYSEKIKKVWMSLN